jgi:hypothetical protein
MGASLNRRRLDVRADRFRGFPVKGGQVLIGPDHSAAPVEQPVLGRSITTGVW